VCAWRRVARRGLQAIGVLWTLPNTLLALAIALQALPFGAQIERVGALLRVTRLPFGPWAALALGSVVLTRYASLDRRVPSFRAAAARRHGDSAAVHERVHLGRHELAHVR
jgi:hypothetical protein